MLPPVNIPILISSVLLLYDYLCTINLEVDYVWPNPLKFRSILFFLNRYSPFVDTFLALGGLSGSISVEECELRQRVASAFIFLGVSISEIILMLRTYALWGCRRWVLILFLCIAVSEISCMIFIMYKHLSSIHPRATETGCKSMSGNSGLLYLAPFVLLAFTETVLAVLSVIKGYLDLRRTREQWVVELYKDGLLYYIYLLVISLCNIVTPLIIPGAGPFLTVPQRVLHSLFCNRVLFFLLRTPPSHSHLHAREGGDGLGTEDGEEEVRFTTVQMTIVSAR